MNISRLMQKAASLSSSDYVTLKDGENRFRFVCKLGEEEPWREVFRHFLPREYRSEGFTGAPLCLGNVANCPGCQLVERLREVSQDAVADKARAQRRYIFTVFARSDNDKYNDAGALVVKLLEVPPTVFQGLGRVIREWVDEDFTDPDTGFDILIARSTSGPMTKYEVKAISKKGTEGLALVRSPLTEDERVVLSESCPDLDAELELPDAVAFAASVGLGGEPHIFHPGPVANLAKPAALSANMPAATVVEESSVDCPVFGLDFDASVTACRSCKVAEECKATTEAKHKNARKPA